MLQPLAMFLSPGFLVAGLVLAAAPIIIHLLNRRRYRIVPWAAIEYLLAAIRKNRRRLQFESWLLLAVRCAALLLLGLALSRPMGCTNTSLAALGQRAGLDVFIIDNSYSMGYQHPRGVANTHLDQAKLIARTLISRMESGSEGVAIVIAASPARAIIAQPTYDLTGATSTIDAISQTAAATDLAGALRLAEKIASQNAALPNKHLYIFSDSTRSALENTQAADIQTLSRQLGNTYSITYFTLGLRSQRNIAISGLHSNEPLVTTKFAGQFLTTVLGFNTQGSAKLQWKLDGRLLASTQSGSSAEGIKAVLDNVAITTGGPHVLSVAADGDDPLPIDNVAYRVISAAGQMKVLLVEGDRGSTPMSGSASFLNVALAPGLAAGKSAESYVQPTLISDLQLPGEVLSDYRAIVLANVPTIDAREADALKQYVSTGGTLLLFMGEQVNAENYNQMLLSRGLLPGALQRRMNAPADSPFHFDFHPNGALDPLLAFLANQPRSGLETAEISSYWQVSLPTNSKAERVLDYTARDKGSGGKAAREGNSSLSADPAIILNTLGEGRVLFFSTTADAQWTTLPAKPVYVPLMHELLRGSIVADDLWMNLNVGDSLSLPNRIKLTASPTLQSPSGNLIPMQLTGNPATYQSAPLQTPGIYHLNTGHDVYPIAVNPPEEEADVRTESPAALRAIFGDAKIDFESDQPPPVTAATDQGKDFGWIAMLVVLGLFGAECLMAMKFGHYKR